METPSTAEGNGAAAAPPAGQMNGTTPHADTSSTPVSAVATASSTSLGGGEQCLSEMNAAFAKCLALVCPPIQYPPHCRFNPVQQDAADLAEIEARLEEFFLHAKQIELLVMETTRDEPRHELELEILNLENELSEKNDLIDKYADVIRGWEGKFKRLDNRMAPERE